MTHSRSLSSVLLVGLVLLFGANAHAQMRAKPACDPIPLPSLGGFTVGTAINDDGVVVGLSDATRSGVDFRPVRWEDGRIAELPQLAPGTLTVPVALNRGGVIAGIAFEMASSAVSDWLLTPVVWIDGKLARLPLEPDASSASGQGRESIVLRDLNDAGQLVGDYADGQGCLLWPSPTEPPVRILGSREHHCEVAGINAHGAIAGFGRLHGTMTPAPFLYRAGSFTPVPMPPGQNGHEVRLQVDHINDLGDVVGSYDQWQVFWTNELGTRLLPFPDARVVALDDQGTAAVIDYRYDSQTRSRVPTLLLIERDGRVSEHGTFPINESTDWRMTGIAADPKAIGLNARRQLLWTESELREGVPESGLKAADAYLCQLK